MNLSSLKNKFLLKVICTGLAIVQMLVLITTLSFAAKSDEEIIKRALTDAFNTIKSLDIENIHKNYYDDNSKQYIAAVESFFNDYPKAKNMGQFLLNEIDYDINEIKTEDGKIIAKVNFFMPDFQKVIGKVMPKILLKNFVLLFKEKLSEKSIFYILETIYDEIKLEKSDAVKYKKIDVPYDFVFKKENGMWILNNVPDIEEKLREAFKIK